MTTHAKLVHAATAYDRKQSTRQGYNHYAMAQYLRRIDEVERDIAEGMALRQALLRGFSGRLLDAMLVAIGEPKFTRDEMISQPLTYSR